MTQPRSLEQARRSFGPAGRRHCAEWADDHLHLLLRGHRVAEASLAFRPCGCHSRRQELTVALGGLSLTKSVHHFINDELMSIFFFFFFFFFFLVGLIRAERLLS